MLKQQVVNVDKLLANLQSLLPEQTATIDRVRCALEDCLGMHGIRTTFEVFKQTLSDKTEPVVAVDDDGCIVFANKGACKLFASSSEELYGKRLTSWLEGDDVDIINQQLDEYVLVYTDADQVIPAQSKSVTFNIKGYKTLMQLTPVPAGQFIGVVLHNVGDRALLKAVVDYLPCGISVVDENLDAVAYNNQFIELQDFPQYLFDNGTPTFEACIRYNCERGDYGDVDPEVKLAEIMALARKAEAHHITRERSDGIVLDIRGSPLPDGGFVTTYMDVTARHHQEQEIKSLIAELEHAALHDQLTGLANRSKLLQSFEFAKARQGRYGQNISLLVIDLDQFKMANDKYGHTVGDQVLSIIGDILGRAVRDTDLPARFGGDEFVVLLPETDSPGAIDLAEKLRCNIAESVNKADEVEMPIRITASLGVATMGRNSRINFFELFSRADEALYLAKDDGGNCVRAI
ncbi:MAG: diguanylate cyclase [Gammaproteobacteria bacterium]|nr:diguanylate cyclase [Gammaproteobacteria bacterium]